MKCPKCKLLNPDTAQRCDCGYDFLINTMEHSSEQKPPIKSNFLNGITAVASVIVIVTGIIVSILVFFSESIRFFGVILNVVGMVFLIIPSMIRKFLFKRRGRSWFTQLTALIGGLGGLMVAESFSILIYFLLKSILPSGIVYHDSEYGKIFFLLSLTLGGAIAFKICDNFVIFSLTEHSLEMLKIYGVPENVMEVLKSIVNQEVTGKKNFLNVVKARIGQEQFVRYKERILKDVDQFF